MSCIATYGVLMSKPSGTHYIKVSAPDDVYDVLKAYAAVLGSTPSTVIRDLLVEIAPSFQGVVDAIRLVDNDKHNALSRIQSVLLNGISDASALAVSVQKGMELENQDVLAEGELKQ